MPMPPIQDGEMAKFPQVTVACRRASRLFYLQERAKPTSSLQLQYEAKPTPLI